MFVCILFPSCATVSCFLGEPLYTSMFIQVGLELKLFFQHWDFYEREREREAGERLSCSCSMIFQQTEGQQCELHLGVSQQ